MPDEFASVTRNDALLGLILGEIEERGPMPFERYMALALYHPTLGYYRSGKRRIGERGDYVTSPQLSPIFGAMVGRQVAQFWERLGAPATLDLVEMGAGDGRLMRDLLDWAARARPAMYDAARPLLVEPDTGLREEQRRAFAHLPVDVRWVRTLDDVAPGSVEGVLLSNELVDSFPVRLFSVRNGVIREVLVGARGGVLHEVEGPPVGDSLPAHLNALVRALPEGARFEVNAGAERWMAAVGGRLARGFVLSFDYGYPAADLYAPWRRLGTLMAFYRHAVAPDPLAHPGEQDLTAHVDFTALVRAGRDHGLEPAGFTTQREFLAALGMQEAVAAQGLSLEEAMARRRAVITLTDPAGLGRVRVLVQAKGVDGNGLAGFVGSASMDEVMRTED